MSNSEELIKEYIVNGGTTWIIDHVSIVRDGGTRMITMSNFGVEPLFIHKTDKTLHSSYPCGDDNMITDETVKAYVLDRLKSHIKHLEMEVRVSNTLIIDLK
jgi:hypothetical protein